jgi:hypothetical protein
VKALSSYAIDLTHLRCADDFHEQNASPVDVVTFTQEASIAWQPIGLPYSCFPESVV